VHKYCISIFHDVLTRKSNTPPQKLVERIVGNSESACVDIKALRWGRKHEPIAKKRYKAYKKLNCKQKVNVHERGVFLCDTCSFLAASPDGVVSQEKTEHLLEIKSPYKWRNSTAEEACKSSNFYCHLDKNNYVTLKRNSRYFTQVQGQIAMCKYSKCEFVVYSLKDMKVIEIKFDHSFWEVLYAKLKTFYIDNVTHVLKFLYLSYFPYGGQNG
jgi:hypothetical protein